MRVMEIMVPATPLMKAPSFATCMISIAQAWVAVDTRACCVCLQVQTKVIYAASIAAEELGDTDLQWGWLEPPQGTNSW